MLVPHQQTNKTSASGRSIKVSVFGQVPYEQAQQAMLEFTSTRTDEDVDQIWLLQHPAVYTLGTACTQNTLMDTDIPLVKTDRGGQITYHGPGQVVMYPLLKLKRYDLGVKSLVANLEQTVINTLDTYTIKSERRESAPGVYVDQAKIAALGLRIKRGCSYHGLSLNVDMDLQPFTNIDPCGYQGLQVTQLKDVVEGVDLDGVQQSLLANFLKLI